MTHWDTEHEWAAKPGMEITHPWRLALAVGLLCALVWAASRAVGK